MDNVISMIDDDTRLSNAYADLTHFGEEIKERYRLNEFELQAIAAMYARNTLDYNYYNIYGLWEEDDD